MLMDSRHVLGTSPYLTKDVCLPEQEDYTERLLILRPEALDLIIRFNELQYFYAEEGDGCDPKSNGGMLFGYLLANGERTMILRGEVLGAADPKKLPKWAADRLAEIQAPKMTVRIFQVDHDKDPQRLAYEPLKDLPNGIVNASMYRQVYGGTVDCSSLEEVFRLCNEEPPPGYCGESMSVGNVIEVQYGRQKGFYYCDKIGFKPIDFDISQTDHDQMLKVLICEPNKAPYPAEIRDCLEAKQSVVGGLIEPVYFTNDKVLAFCDEEFLYKGYAPNRMLGETLIQGTFFIVGDACNEYGEMVEVSLTDEQLNKYAAQFSYPLVDISDNEICHQESQEIDMIQA